MEKEDFLKSKITYFKNRKPMLYCNQAGGGMHGKEENEPHKYYGKS